MKRRSKSQSNSDSHRRLINKNKHSQKLQLKTQQKQLEQNSISQISSNKKSSFIINGSLLNSFNPKRTSMDLNAFIQVFRKKMRQSSIAKQFQKSIDKFQPTTTNKINRQNGGFVGSCRKQSQLQIQNNIIDNKIKKIIISDIQFKKRKKRISQSRLNLQQNQAYYTKTSKKMNIHTQNSDSYSQRQRILNNNINKYSTLMNQNYDQTNPQNQGKMSSIFTNHKLDSICCYQKPNLMYNLSLYRKKRNTLANTLGLNNKMNTKSSKNKNKTQQKRQNHNLIK